MEETKKKLFVERDGFWTEGAMLLIALAMVFRLIGSIGRWQDTQYLTTQVALPILCGLLFLLCLLLFGKIAFWTTVVPVVMGVVFFVFRAMSMENEWLRGCWIIVYLVIMVLYAMVFSYPRLKWALALVLLAVFAYHLGLQDLPKLMDLEHPVSFVDGMEELSVLGTILAMLFVCIAMKSAPKPAKAKPEKEPEQPAVPEEKDAEAVSVPAEEPAPAEAEEKTLSRREKRRLEKERKLAEKQQKKEAEPLPEPEPEPLPEPLPEPEPEPLPEPQPEPEPLPEPEPEPLPEPVPEPEPQPEEIPVEEIPVEELEPRAEPAAVYPLEEQPEAADKQNPAPEVP